MERVALVAPERALRAVLVQVADSGVMEIERGGDEPHTQSEAGRRLRALHPADHVDLRLSLDDPDLDRLVEEERIDLIAGEADLQDVAGRAVRKHAVAALAGWMPTSEMRSLGARIAGDGGALVVIPRPRGIDPPTRMARGSAMRRSLNPLVQTYGTVPYRDIDPSVLAGMSYMAMFGMMFGDVGHGLLLVAIGLLLRAGIPRRFAGARKAWPFVVGAGIAATVAGFLYGEFFGPTGVVPPLWIRPLEEPITLLVAALGVGAVLLGGAYALGTVNRWREGGWALAVYAPSGLAGSGLFLGLGLGAAWWLAGATWLLVTAIVVFVLGLLLVFIGLLAESGGGMTGVLQSVVELFDNALRVGSNLLSFARLAAFGLAHAALGDLVWSATGGLLGKGIGGWIGAAVVFVVGNALAFTLEALVAAVQALRLEYYELFSRVFVVEGRPFQPWHVPCATDGRATDSVSTTNRSETPA
jgi:V/A-type H+-transporting ATPase subunit I